MLNRIFFILIVNTISLYSQTFNELLNQINSSPESNRVALVDSYLSVHPITPIIEQDTNVFFIYRGSANSINVSGDMNGWITNALPMTKVSTTDLWYCKASYESDARIDYKFVLNGSNWIFDPRNPYQCSGGFGPNSELRMPAYIPAPEIQYDLTIPHGALRDTIFFSSALNNSRKISIYTPPGYDTSSLSYPVIIFHDGLEYISLAQANNVIDYLIANNKIEPIIAVFIPPVNRTPEYAGNQIIQFSAFIVNDVLNYVDAQYRTKRDAVHRATIGASNSGNISLYLGLNYPNVFGNVAAQSSNIQSSISSGFQTGQKLNLKLYLDLGTYDIASLIPLVKNFIPTIRVKGYQYVFKEYHEGHSWGNWRAHIDDALIFFFGKNVSNVKSEGEIPRQFQLEQNYPNPFNSSTTITLTPILSAWDRVFEEQVRVSLYVYDTLGRQVMKVNNDAIQNSRYHSSQKFIIRDSDLRSTGCYYYRLADGAESQTKMMLYLK